MLSFGFHTVMLKYAAMIEWNRHNSAFFFRTNVFLENFENFESNHHLNLKEIRKIAHHNVFNMYLTSAKPVSPRARALYNNQSSNQSIKQKAPSHSINQSIHNWLEIFTDSTNQAINQLFSSGTFYVYPNPTINWLPFQNQFLPWIVEVSRF